MSTSSMPQLTLFSPALRAQARRTLGNKVADLFLALCAPLRPEDRARLGHEVNAYLGRLELGLGKNHFLDLYLAQRLVSASQRLLAASASLPEERRAMIHGAVRYFLRPNDASHDVNAMEGLEDDAQVLAWVAELCGVALPEPLEGDEP